MSKKSTTAKRAVRPRDAATLVLLRQVRGKTTVLMGLRHGKHKFMPDQWVFPGGRVDRADGYAHAASELRPHVTKHLARTSSAHRARALAMAAVRELFEETGMILGQRLDQVPKGASSSWAPFYQAGYAPILDSLEYVYRAVTPPIRPIRFNARFFLADGSNLHGKLQGDGELLNLSWVPIPKAIELPTPPIQQIVLEALPDMVDDAGQIRRHRRVPVRIMRYGERRIEYE
ncbi:MAG: NUDIX hydrolase [Rhodospirillaceae bacterium]|mgnify:CR=1 FL=1|jgi:8-oxo-dGTP pyrophosphatase MutT (NUDIX family)|nr:NUDIX hydrolase [Rhodospirillaceae bacterium]MBT5195511.1 NUDIX hydrolase [Rhodospirillaceae bacterium]MBT5894787.1 NUDIX hydrolase [Rhodospirillaceae bacterium]MBT7760464.1 NUDIX hydrolase [Rhodospirillaceae bacterium]